MLAVPRSCEAASEPNAVLVVSAENSTACAVAEDRNLRMPARKFMTKYTLNETPTPSSSGRAMMFA